MILRLGERQPEYSPDSNYIADSARVIGSVRLRPGASVWFGAVLRGDNDWINVGRDSNIQDNAVLHTDPGLPLTIGDRVTVGHSAVLHGCSVGAGSLIGIGSTVLNGARLGSNCLVGARTLITENREFPGGVLILGTPARIVRELEQHELDALAASADIYVRNSARFLDELRGQSAN